MEKEGLPQPVGPIYVVDDEPSIGQILGLFMERENLVHKIFQDPAKALAAADTEDPPPRLLVTDYNMPSMSGMDLIAALRQRFPAIRTILMSGTVEEGVLDAYEEKPDHFQPKPFKPLQLMERIHALLKDS